MATLLNRREFETSVANSGLLAKRENINCLLISADLSGLKYIDEITERVNYKLHEHYSLFDPEYKIHITLGASEINPGNNKSYSDLLQEADKNLYSSK